MDNFNLENRQFSPINRYGLDYLGNTMAKNRDLEFGKKTGKSYEWYFWLMAFKKFDGLNRRLIIYDDQKLSRPSNKFGDFH